MVTILEIVRARTALKDLFFDIDEDDRQSLNLNDVFGWACADVEDVLDEELPYLAELYHLYGWCGVLYWVSKKRDGQQSEFFDVNRHIQFVKNEEEIRSKEPSDSKRAYLKQEYSIG